MKLDPDLAIYPGKVIYVPYDPKNSPLHLIMERLKEERRSRDAVMNLLDEEDRCLPSS